MSFISRIGRVLASALWPNCQRDAVSTLPIIITEYSCTRSGACNTCGEAERCPIKYTPEDKTPAKQAPTPSDKQSRGVDPALADKIRPYLDILVAEGFITKDYQWIKGIGHTNYQAAYIARIIHSRRPSISQNAIGQLFGIKSISTYLAKLDTKESIKRPLEDLFANVE